MAKRKPKAFRPQAKVDPSVLKLNPDMYQPGTVPFGIHSARIYRLSEQFKITALRGLYIQVRGRLGKDGRFIAMLMSKPKDKQWKEGEHITIAPEDIRNYSKLKLTQEKVQQAIKEGNKRTEQRRYAKK